MKDADIPERHKIEPYVFVISDFATMRRITMNLLREMGFRNLLGFASIDECKQQIETSDDKGDLIWLFCFPDDAPHGMPFTLEGLSDLPGLTCNTWRFVLTYRHLPIPQSCLAKNVRRIPGWPFTKAAFEDGLRAAVGSEQMKNWFNSNSVDKG